MIRALVFDFDGLILETETPAYETWAEIYREHGHELPLDRWFDYIGREGGFFDAADQEVDDVFTQHDDMLLKPLRRSN